MTSPTTPQKVDAAKLATICPQKAPQDLETRISTLKSKILSEQNSITPTDSLKNQVTDLEKSLNDGKLFQLPMIRGIVFAIGTIFATTVLGIKQYSIERDISTVLTWSALRVGLFFTAIHTTTQLALHWTSEKKDLRENSVVKIDQNRVSHIFTIVFPFISQRWKGYDSEALEQQITEKNVEISEIKDRNLEKTKSINNLTAQIEVLTEFSSKFEEHFNTHLNNHALYNRFKGCIADVLFLGTSKSNPNPKNSKEWEKTLTTYLFQIQNPEPDSKEKIPLTSGEVEALKILNFSNYLLNIESENTLFEAFARFHYTSTAEIKEKFCAAVVEKASETSILTEDDIILVSKKLSENFSLNIEDEKLSANPPFTPKKEPQEVDSKKEEAAPFDSSIPSHGSTSTMWENEEEGKAIPPKIDVPVTPKDSEHRGEEPVAAGLTSPDGTQYVSTEEEVDLAASTSTIESEEEEEEEGFELHINSPPRATEESSRYANIATPDSRAFNHESTESPGPLEVTELGIDTPGSPYRDSASETESSPVNRKAIIEELRTPKAKKSSIFTEKQQTAALTFLARLIDENPDHPEARRAEELRLRIAEKSKGSPFTFNRMLTRIEDDKSITISSGPVVLKKE